MKMRGGQGGHALKEGGTLRSRSGLLSSSPDPFPLALHPSRLGRVPLRRQGCTCPRCGGVGPWGCGARGAYMCGRGVSRLCGPRYEGGHAVVASRILANIRLPPFWLPHSTSDPCR